MEFGTPERPQPWRRPRRKAGLETPLKGRMGKENKRLTFSPPPWYDALVVACFAGGLVAIFYAFASGDGFMLWIAAAVFASGIWAALSNERIACNLTNRTYLRMEGQGLRKRMVHGNLSDLDALVVVTETVMLPIPGTQTVIYRMVLHWKGAIHPLLVVERETHSLTTGMPLQSLAGGILQRGYAYSKALGIPFFDNTYYPSPCPVPVA